MSAPTRYPLAWPTGWARTKARKRWPGKMSIGRSIEKLSTELRRLGAVREIVSSNVPVRVDGRPYADAAERRIQDPGVAVYFELSGKPRCLACDTWDTPGGNIAALAAHIECLRGIDRYGVGTLDQAFAGYTALPAKGETWRTTLGFSPEAAITADAIRQAFREQARSAHPDAGGSHEAMAALNAAMTEGLLEIRS